MKVKLAICLCAVLMPLLAIADEAEVGKRRYLKQSEYKDPPHKFVLLMKSRGRNHCTANLVQTDDGSKIITARHCLGSCANGTIYEFYTLNNQTVSAKVDSDSCGNFDIKDANTISGDYAILTPTQDMDALEFGTVCETDVDRGASGVMTGYGVLKPLDDKDVTHFVRAYLRFLFDAEMGLPVGTSKDADVNELNNRLTAEAKGIHDVSSEGGHTLVHKNMCATDFMSSASYYDIEVDKWFNDVHPKTRECKVTAVDDGDCGGCIKLDCNVWQGDSGAGFWVKIGVNDYCFAGVLSQGFDDIGGKNSIGKGTVQVAPASKIVFNNM